MPASLLAQFAGHGSGCAVRNVRHNVDGDFVMTCGADKIVNLFSLSNVGDVESTKPSSSCRLLKSYKGHGNEVLDVCGSCDNSTLVSCSKDKTVIVWDVTTAMATSKLRGHVASVNCVLFNEDSSLVLSGSQDGSVRCWDALASPRRASSACVQVLDESRDAVTSIDVSDHEILVASADGRVRRYDIRNGKMAVDVVVAHAGHPLSSALFTNDNQCILVACVGEDLRLFDKSTGELLQQFKGHLNNEYRIQALLNHNDQRVISGSEDGKIYVWSLIEANLVATYPHDKNSVVHSLSQHPKKAQLISVAKDKVYIWEDVESEEEDHNDRKKTTP